ncbi:MAG: 30S ribosomal protein S9, small subunit ribosomal protein S9 [Candidatus Peregrinibacteria bacterium GW2011_GWF2_39_17]|nr:MAG: 30S ribosomal protein S9, small subunit ribosomal protein S9 [Candidatus Peregrinibacteria bacterium GW2011_GWF2_39_17]HCW32696.1 30S ribosomal protein S9 [Candidatus Peregrinibacteria bacterium]
MPTKKKEETNNEAPANKGLRFNGPNYYAHGKRKTSIARVRLYPKGQGRILINNISYREYLTIKETHEIVISPLMLCDQVKNVDIAVKVEGGGPHSQAEAIRHGISKALQTFNPEFRPVLKKAGFLTRDSRIKERKKFGLKRARRAPQFSKR